VSDEYYDDDDDVIIESGCRSSCYCDIDIHECTNSNGCSVSIYLEDEYTFIQMASVFY
jgi:hypothetical protein